MSRTFTHPSRRIVLLLFASVIFALGLVFSEAETRGQTQSRQLQQGGATSIGQWPGKAKRWALVIGVDQYRDAQIGALRGSVNDAHTLAASLVKYAGFPQDQVIVLTTDQPEEKRPTRINILTYLSNLASLVPKDGLLLVSFAGHGIERGGQAYLIPSDARLTDDISLLEESAVSVSRMHDRIKAIHVSQVVVLLDACRNDPGGRADAPNNMSTAYTKFNFDVRNREVQAFATFYATQIGQRAYEYTEKRQGYFTWAIVEGLKGAAANEKGEITLSALVKYVQENVPRRIAIDLGASKQQKPFATIEGYRADELVIATAAPNTANPASAPPTVLTADTSALDLSFWETIKSSNDPNDFQAYLDRFPSGTFAALAKKRATVGTATAPAPAYNPGPAAPAPATGLGGMSVDDAMAQASRDYQDGDFGKAYSLANTVLASNPQQPRANLLVGLYYWKIKKFINSASYLTRAIALGEQVIIPIQHHHYVIFVGDNLCTGYLTFGRGNFEFHSTSMKGHDVSVPASKVVEVKVETLNSGRINIKFFIQKKDKEERKTYNYMLPSAVVGKRTGSTVTEIFCEGCFPELQATAVLIQQLIKASAERQEVSAPASPATSSAPSGGGGDQNLAQELINLEQQGMQYVVKGDPAGLSAMMANEYVLVEGGKTYSKQEVISNLKSAKTTGLALSFESATASMEGERAVLRGIAVLKGQSGTSMVTQRNQFVDTFVKRDGRWLMIRSEVTVLK
jgi:uncharacterized caspase-like protein